MLPLELELERMREKRDTIQIALAEIEEIISQTEGIENSIETVVYFAEREFKNNPNIEQKITDCLTDLFFQEIDNLNLKMKNEIENLKENI